MTSEKLTDAAREVTPEGKQSYTDRLLVPSIFQSPVKSFSRATKPPKERKAPRFLGDDSDDLELANPPGQIDQPEKKKAEDLDEWMTDGSSDGKKHKGKGDGQALKPKVKVRFRRGYTVAVY